MFRVEMLKKGCLEENRKFGKIIDYFEWFKKLKNTECLEIIRV